MYLLSHILLHADIKFFGGNFMKSYPLIIVEHHSPDTASFDLNLPQVILAWLRKELYDK